MPMIDGMLVQSDGSKPHVVYIMHRLAKTFPNVIWKLGGKVDRKTRGGGFSAHSVGRAIDIYLDAGDRLDQKLGDLLFQMFHTHARDLKVDHTIWNRKWWDGGRVENYPGSGGPHRDHVHVAFKDDHLEELPYVFDALVSLVVAAYVTGGDGAADRQDGIHGKAFSPRSPNVRLSHSQRKKVLLKNMGMEGA